MKSVSYILTVLVVGSVFTHMALADQYCNNNSGNWKASNCATIGGGTAVTAGSGIYALKKYSQVNSIEKEFNKKVFSHSDSATPESAIEIKPVTNSFTDGDRITVNYHLSEAANRQHHISLMESNASSARSNAIMYAASALTASRPVYTTVTNADGSTSEQYAGTEPDFAQRALYGAMAVSEESKHGEYLAKAEDARRGGPVPTYNFEKVIEGEKGTASSTMAFAEEQLKAKGRIVSIYRLPAEQFKSLKAVRNLGRAGVVGAVIGGAFVAEEATVGAVSEKIQSNTDHPNMRGFDGY